MTQLSHPRRTRILSPTKIASSEQNHHQQENEALAIQCRDIFEKLRPQLIETYYNWHIAIDPNTEEYLIDPRLKGITQKIRDTYGYSNQVKLTIFRLNDTGSCGRF
ncbi:MAG: hypothetical protein HC836_35235 [Richelia sp. RM2_1_2]|nr:hypothetical protein [Richelia sp. RM2_1_2]